MNDRHTTLFALNALPTSKRPLMDFYCLQHLRCETLESTYILPPPRWTTHSPEGDLFQCPIQITILGINDHFVDLGVYAHPALLVQQGPKPRRQWLEQWREAPFLNYNQPNSSR